MSSQYSSPHAFFMTKNSEGTSNAEKTTKHKKTLRSCPEVLTKRAVGGNFGGGYANKRYSLLNDNPPPRTPSPERPSVQQPCYPRNNYHLENKEAMVANLSPPFCPSSVDAETRLPSSLPKLQRRALPIPNDPLGMSHKPILNNDSRRDWLDLATEGAAQNRAVVILQGELEESMLKDLENCLRLMGFDNPEILHKPKGQISKQEFESRADSLVNALAPRSNLLLMICERDYGYIELAPDFLDKRIYSRVAKYNQRKEAEFIESVTKSKIVEFDSRRFEGVTLHVIIDGLNVHPLKHILRLRLAEAQKDVMKSKWKDLNVHQDSNRSILNGRMGHGDVVQFWVSRDMYGYAPFLLLKAILCICLEEPELPYQILLLRLKTILHKTLEASLCQHPFGQGNPRKNIRAVGGIAAFTAEFLIRQLASYLSERALECKRKQDERDIFDGNYILSSVDKFDPHRSLKLNWKY